MKVISVIFITMPDVSKAVELSKTVVSLKLAACVNILPAIRSIYSWEGKIEDQSEVLLMAKTSKERVPELMKKVIELHPYSTPEFIEVENASAFEKYADWVQESTGA